MDIVRSVLISIVYVVLIFTDTLNMLKDTNVSLPISIFQRSRLIVVSQRGWQASAGGEAQLTRPDKPDTRPEVVLATITVSNLFVSR